jgi:pilus assembly protein Flp/PilA
VVQAQTTVACITSFITQGSSKGRTLGKMTRMRSSSWRPRRLAEDDAVQARVQTWVTFDDWENPMAPLASRMAKFLRNEDGLTAPEYAMMLALILVACIVIVTSLGTDVSGTFSM